MARKKRSRATDEPGSPKIRRLEGTFDEWRFEPKATVSAYVGVVLMSLGGILAGVGAYAVFLRDDALAPIVYGPWALLGGFIFIAVFLIIGQRKHKVLRVGELGVGVEESGRVLRLLWFEIDKLDVVHDQLRIATAGRPVNVALSEHLPAIRRIVSEALTRVPKRVDIDDDDMARIGKPSSDDGDKITTDPPQVTGMHCRNTDEPLTFERDVRMCGRCGAVYHKKGVPRRCKECGARLKS